MELRCRICRNPSTAAISREIGSGIPYEVIASHFPDTSKSSIARHARNCLGVLRNKEGDKEAKRAAQGSARNKAGRFSQATTDDGRCKACLTKVEGDLSGEDLKRRGERIFHIAESIALKAQDADDSRLVLMALDRASRSFETLARVAGLLGPDSISINIHAQKERDAYDLLSQLTLSQIEWAMANPDNIRRLASIGPLSVDAEFSETIPALTSAEAL
jgi:hypothetical protein